MRSVWLLAGAGLVALIVAVSVAAGAPRVGCSAARPLAAAAVAGYAGEQLVNAATIIDVAAARGLPTQAQVVGVATAMGESSLRNIDYGDWETSGVRNPDGSPTTSIGLFQQQDNWGTREQRLDPATAAGLFYDALVEVPGWAELPVTIAAHRTQINADPNHYARYERPARQVVAALAGTPDALGRC